MSKAAEEAILKWITGIEKENLSFEGDPVEAIEGLLSDVDLDSVKLQHESVRIWMTKVLGHIPS